MANAGTVATLLPGAYYFVRETKLPPIAALRAAGVAMALATDGDAPGAEPLLRRAVAQPAATQKMRLNLAMVLGLQGKTGEAEQIIRRELPPEAADRNLRWLQNQSRPQPGRTTEDASPAPARTWSSLQTQ